MNSFEDLNDYSDEQLTITDERPFSIVYSDDTTQDYNITIDEGDTHIVPVPISVAAFTSAQDCYYTITFNWDGSTVFAGQDVSIPGFIKLSDYVWQATITGLTDFENYKAPSITSPADINYYSYTVTFAHPVLADGSTTGKTWTVNVTVNDASEITTPTDSDYDEDFAGLITGYPQVTNVEDTDPSSSYTVEVYPEYTSSISTLSSAGSGGSSSFNSGTKKLTLAGTRTQVNSHLAAITLTPAIDVDYDFILYYKVTNPISAVQTTVSQWLRINALNQETSGLGNNRTYVGNSVNTLIPNDANKIEIIENTSGTPTYTISFTLGTAIGEIHIGDLSGWDATTRTFTYTGTKDQCNTKILDLKFFPVKDTTSTATLRYKQYRDTTLQSDDTVNLSNTSTASVSGAGITSYTSFDNQIYTYNLTLTYEQARYLNCDLLIVAGGGMGGNGGTAAANGGGGAGGLKHLVATSLFKDNVTYLGPKTFTIGVGGGGAGAGLGTAMSDPLRNGKGSYIKKGDTTLISVTGGGGGGHAASSIPQRLTDVDGNSGGSGGGGAYRSGQTVGKGGAGISGEGNNGSNAAGSGGGGGGGGAGGAGQSDGTGGTGYATNISGTSITYAVGGSRLGSAASTPGSGGAGGIFTYAGGKGASGIVRIKFY